MLTFYHREQADFSTQIDGEKQRPSPSGRGKVEIGPRLIERFWYSTMIRMPA